MLVILLMISLRIRHGCELRALSGYIKFCASQSRDMTV